MTDLYVQPHRSQYKAGASLITRRAGCTWASLANGIGAVSGGRYQPSPDAIHALVPNAEETSPGTPGWSITDAALAAARFGVTLEDRSGLGWLMVLDALLTGHYILLQGDSDQFGDGSCSGAYDGPHAVGVHPKTKTDPAGRWWWVNDPICTTGRWEREVTLQRYAVKFSSAIRFGVFTQRVPNVVVVVPAKPVVLRFRARKLARPVAKRIRVPRGRRANVRTAPRRNARIADRRATGERFYAYQVTDRGQVLGKSGRWYGNRKGDRWCHASAF